MPTVGVAVLILGAAAIVATAISPVALRKLAALLLARALYIENIRAEKARYRVMCEERRQEWLKEFGCA